MSTTSHFLRIFLESMNTPAVFFLTSVFLIETMLLLAALFNGNIYKKQLPKTLTIIRGVPGAGKRYLVSQLEQDNNEIFAVCDKNQYFMTNGTYNFNGADLSKAEQSSRLELLKAVSKGVRNIYVINYFNELWMYREYLQIANMHNYNTQILEIPCPDDEHLSYFNNRSTHKAPHSKSKKCYTHWESDVRSVYCEPFVKSFPGDCIPTLNTIDLDRQLEDYKTKSEDPYTETDAAIEESQSLIKYDKYINFISKPFHDRIFHREMSSISELKKGVIYDLKEDTPIKI